MPWVCSGCGGEVGEDDLQCPGCASPKTSWTMVAEQTRAMVISKRRWELQRASAGGRVPARNVRAVPRTKARRWSEAGQAPPADDLLYVRLFAGKTKKLDVSVVVKFAHKPVTELSFPRERADDDGEDPIERPFLFVYGTGEDVSFEGVDVVDLSEETQTGYAPKIELTALRKRPKELPVEGAEAPGRRGFLLEMEDLHFHHDSAVLLPDHPREDGGDHGERLTGLSVLLTCYLQAEAFPSQKLLVAGHTDTTGADEYNLTLSRQRAQNVYLALTGDRAGWVESCEAKHTTADVQQIVHWARETFGWECDPGPVDDKAGPKTKAGVEAFQERYNQAFDPSISVDGIVGPQTWGAVFDCYDFAQAQYLGTDAEGLARRRAGLTFLTPPFVGCGEHHPIEAVGKDVYRSDVNRRVEVVFFDPEEVPELTCHASDGACDPGACPLYAGEEKYTLEAIAPETIGVPISKLLWAISEEHLGEGALVLSASGREQTFRAADAQARLGSALWFGLPVTRGKRYDLAVRGGGHDWLLFENADLGAAIDEAAATGGVVGWGGLGLGSSAVTGAPGNVGLAEGQPCPCCEHEEGE